jgi:hypothetical protein
MNTQVCPYLGTVDDQRSYFPTPDVANRCYAVASLQPARTALDFQESVCLAGHPGRCARYVEAERHQARKPAPRLLAIGGSLAGVVALGCCAFLAVLVLALGGLGVSRLGLLARVTDTPPPTATDTVTVTATLSPTWTATATLTPTEQVTNTATVTPLPASPTPTVSPVNAAGDTFVSPLATPALRATTTQPRAVPTNRPLPTATRRPAATATRGPTLTPSATNTRAPTATPQMVCRTGDTMTFNPASPLTGKAFTIEVRSLMGYVEVLLAGGGKPHFNGVDQSGSYYIWRWEDRVGTAGTYTYNFQIRNGAATCLTKSVTVVAPTNTPSPTPTVAPVYKFELALSDKYNYKPIYTDTQPVDFELELINNGNVTDTFEVWLKADGPEGWTAEYCIGDINSCYTESGTVTLPAGESQALFIKLTAPSDAQEKDQFFATLSAKSQGDGTTVDSPQVTVAVATPTPTTAASSAPTTARHR